MSLLTILNDVCDDLRLRRPTSAYGSVKQQERALLRAANASGIEIMRAHHWGALLGIATITTVASQTTYDLASDYDRMIPDTAWDNTNFRQLLGSQTPQVFNFLNYSGVASVGLRYHFRTLGTTIELWPAPSANNDELPYAYVSKNWVTKASDGLGAAAFTADDDTTKFDDQLMIAYIKHKYIAGRGLYSAAMKKEAMDLLSQRVYADMPGTVLNMAPDPMPQFISDCSIQESDWNIA